MRGMGASPTGDDSPARDCLPSPLASSSESHPSAELVVDPAGKEDSERIVLHFCCIVVQLHGFVPTMVPLLTQSVKQVG